MSEWAILRLCAALVYCTELYVWARFQNIHRPPPPDLSGQGRRL
jgi:hypothetical protein